MPSTFESLTKKFRREWGWLASAWFAVGGALAAMLWLDHQEVEATERKILAHDAQFVHDRMADELRAVNRGLESVVMDLQHWRNNPDRLERIRHRLSALAGAIVHVRVMFLLDTDGTVLASSRPELVGRNAAERSLFVAASQAASTDTLIVTPPYHSELDAWVIALGRVVPGPDGGFGGVVAATLDSDKYFSTLKSIRHAPDMVLTLAHGDGIHFLTVANNNVLLGQQLPASKPDLVVLHTVQPPGLKMDKPLVIAVGREWDKVFAHWRTKVWILGGAHSLVGLMAACVLTFLQGRRRQLWQQRWALEQQSADMEARWRATLEATNQGVWDWSARTNQVYFSPVWKSMLGYTEDDVGTSLDDWQSRVHPDDLERTLADIQRHLRGETAFYESVHRMRCKDGSYRWILDRGRIVERDVQGQPLRLMGTHSDVNEQHEYQETLARLTENVPGALYQYQRETDGHSHFPYASAGIQDIYAYPPEALREDASPVFGRIHADDLQRVLEHIEQSARTLKVWHDEYRVILPERGERWINGLARPQRLDTGAVRWYGYLHDITRAKLQALQLHEAQRLLQHLMDQMPIGLAMVDVAGNVFYLNQHFCTLFGYTLADLPTQEQWWLKVFPGPEARTQARDTWTSAVAQAASHGGHIPNADYQITARDGTQRTLAVGGLIFGSNMLVTFVDQTEQHALSERMRQLAYMDGLTGVANRRHFDEALQSEWARCLRNGQPLALVMIDIDHFKRYNDTYGHQQGDACLQTVARVLRAGFRRAHDLVARYGGEEFVCLMPECDLAGVRVRAQALCQAVHGAGLAHSSSPTASVVTISLGVACLVPDAASCAQDLVARADANLYRAKLGGRNRVDDGTGAGADSQPCA